MDHFHSPRFSAHVRELMDRFHVPGLAIALVQGDKIVSAGYGKARLDSDTPCTPDTLFDIASASKSMTAGSVSLLVEDEAHPDVTWDARMKDLLPEDFAMSKHSYTEEVTLDDIISHRTGLPCHDSCYLGVRSEHTDTPQSVTRNLQNLAISAPLRTKYMYNNMMYTVATHLIEQKTGHTFTDFLNTNFFKPLNMTSTSLQPSSAIAKGHGDRIATGYRWREETQDYIGFASPDAPDSQGAGIIMSSVNDYIRWVKAVMNQEPPVTPAVYEGMTRMRTICEPGSRAKDNFAEAEPFTSPPFYAAGWSVLFYRGHRFVVHYGGVPGFSSVHFFLPAQKLGAAMFGNSAGANEAISVLMHEFIDEAVGVPVGEREDWVKREIEYKAKEEEEEDEEKGKEKGKGESWADSTERQPQTTPLDAYAGKYWNEGYKGMVVQVKRDRLWIDASDRSMGFYIDLEHVRNQTKYVAHLTDFLDEDELDDIEAEFRFENGRVVQLGLMLEPDMDEKIWFDRKG